VRHPARLIVLAFLAATLAGAGLLTLPVASAGPERVDVLPALFTSASAVCVTGLAVVDTRDAWSGFGESVIVVLVQLGGIGIMTAASIVALAVSRRVGIRARTLTRSETGSVDPGEVRRTLVAVATFSILIEAVIALVLLARGMSLWNAVFHSVMTFNNAGFARWPDGLSRFVDDPVVSLSITAGVVLGGLGFPVLFEVWRSRREPRRWSMHTKLTLLVTGLLLVVGAVATLGFEWTNPDTLGPLSAPVKVLASVFHSSSTRTAGFNTVDVSAMREDTWLLSNALMFIGSGSASTGGGIKVTTFAVLLIACWAELRGNEQPHAFGRHVPPAVIRQALTITIGALVVVGAGATLLMLFDPFLLDRALFEAISAFGTVGLSTGITADLSAPSQATLIVLMFLGRVGPATLGAALVLRQRTRLYEFPEGRPLVG
jgi:trk system potassium uptake protein